MKKFILLIALFTVNQLNSKTFFDQLCEFNPNWEDYADRIKDKDFQVFESDKAYIQAHLGAVLSILNSNSTKHLNKVQKESRKKLIALLSDYRLAGNFPKNYYREDRTPVFIDEHGTHCAVGYLLQQTGYEVVAQRISKTNNYTWVKDINDSALPAWQVESGFTLNELKLIQGAYDSYLENAMFLWNRYEIPQRPVVLEAYFPANDDDKQKIWCLGEGKDGILNGRWIQNYSSELPWIIGFYEDGKRTGQWAEYYQGTDCLCRTEHWSDDKLNGVRTRFDMNGNIIEEILFKDGEAVVKTNYDLEEGLRWERTPLDSNKVYTKVYDDTNKLVAKGHETIHNPGNLLWFQNIELTVLNSISVSARDIELPGLDYPQRHIQNFQSPPLVNYLKEGDWIYFQDNSVQMTNINSNPQISNPLYAEISAAKNNSEVIFNSTLFNRIDSVQIAYESNEPIAYHEFNSYLNVIQIGYPGIWPPYEITPWRPYEIWDPKWYDISGMITYVFYYEHVIAKNYLRFMNWEEAKNDLFIFNQGINHFAKLEDPVVVGES